jgi:hypothetical protein
VIMRDNLPPGVFALHVRVGAAGQVGSWLFLLADPSGVWRSARACRWGYGRLALVVEVTMYPILLTD